MSSFINVKEENIHAFINQGSGKESIIFLHPALAQAAFYMPLVGEFKSSEITTIAVDFPNHGQSEGKSRRTIEEMADFVYDFVDVLQAKGIIGDKINLVGWSMGGTVSYEIATRKPSWLKTISMLSSSNNWNFAPLVFTEEEYDAGKCKKDLVTVEEKYIGGFLETSKSFLPPFSSCDGDWNACSTYDGRAKASMIEVPVYHAWGDKDELGASPANEEMTTTIKTSLPDFHEGSTHNLPAEIEQHKHVEIAASILELVLHGVKIQ